MTQPTAAQGKTVDKSNNPQIQDRQAAITRMTASVGTPASSLEADGTASHNDDFATLNDKLVEILDVVRYHGLIAGGTQVTEAVSRFVDKSNNPQLGARQTAITAITDSTGGTATDTTDYASNPFHHNCASLVRDINLVLDAMEYHGLITGSGTQVSEAVSRFVDKSNVPQLGVRQSAIANLTDNTTGTGTDTVVNTNPGPDDDVASLAAKLNAIINTLELHGLVGDN